MAGMQDTKRRITSVQSTRKITNAMELVASAKLRRAREKYTQSREYFETIQQDIADIISSSFGKNNVYLQSGEGKTLYIVITSDLGLCGGYNANVYKMVRETFGLENEYIVLGNKGVSYFKNRSENVVKALNDATSDPNHKDAALIGNIALDKFLNKEISTVKLVYTKFINSVTFEATTKTILPVEVKDSGSKSVVEYEPSAETLLEMLIPRYVSSSIYGYMIESLVSEQANRRLAMENATDNAEELIELLKLEYNRARQAAITQEISEIVAGANAI